MNLDYDVLWIDDRPLRVQNAINYIGVRLARKGFNFRPTIIEHAGDDRALKKHFRNTDFDLLVVDYKMQPDERDGAALIKSIRNFCDSTDIVFYSSEAPSTLRGKINVDGVYCANRNNLAEKLENVVHSTIKKVLDLNNMRGISLAQLADFDHLIDEAISSGYEKLTSKGLEAEILDLICETVSGFHKSSQEKIAGMSRNQPISDYTKLLSSNPKYNVLVQILSLLDDEALDQCARRISDYENEIIGPRNKLAHALEKRIEGKNYILENKLKELRFDNDDFTNLRLKLLEYGDQFRQIRNRIASL